MQNEAIETETKKDPKFKAAAELSGKINMVGVEVSAEETENGCEFEFKLTGVEKPDIRKELTGKEKEALTARVKEIMKGSYELLESPELLALVPEEILERLVMPIEAMIEVLVSDLKEARKEELEIMLKAILELVAEIRLEVQNKKNNG